MPHPRNNERNAPDGQNFPSGVFHAMDQSLVRRIVEESRHLEGFDPSLLSELLLLAETKEFGAEAIVFRKDEPNDGTFLLILDGEIAVIDDANGDELARRGQGELLGEIAQSAPEPKRTATVMAAEPLLALSWSYEEISRKKPRLAEALRSKFEEVGFARWAEQGWRMM